MKSLELEIRDLVFDTIPLEYEISKVTSATTLKSLGLSSLEIIDVIFELEDKYDIHIGTEEMFQIDCLSELAGLIQSKIEVA